LYLLDEDLAGVAAGVCFNLFHSALEFSISEIAVAAVDGLELTAADCDGNPPPNDYV
jgi:hypothetical protein